MFMGRETESATLEEQYRYDRFTCAVILGRRRVGKTALINQFLEGKKAVFLATVDGSPRLNLENWSQSITESIKKTEPGSVFSSASSALEFLFRGSEAERIVLVIDDFPRADKVFGSLAEELRRLIDQYRSRSRMMLILSGSPVSVMEERLLSPGAPLSDTVHAVLRLEPFDFEEACWFLKGFNPTDKAIAYGIFGGTPRNLLLLKDSQSIRENVRRCFLDSGAPLLEEPPFLLRQDVREPGVYTALLSAIASGAMRMSDISRRVGENTSVCATYLKVLMDLGLVEREIPYGEEGSRKAVYTIPDNTLRFWYRFIPKNLSLIARGETERVWQLIEPELNEYMAEVFRDICRQFLQKAFLSGRSPVAFDSLGRWWGPDPLHKQTAEIDIMGAESDGRAALFAGCFWGEDKAGPEVLDSLIEKSRLFPYKKTSFFLFSRVGFTRECSELSRQRGDVRLVSFDQKRA